MRREGRCLKGSKEFELSSAGNGDNVEVTRGRVIFLCEKKTNTKTNFPERDRPWDVETAGRFNRALVSIFRYPSLSVNE